MLAKRGHTPWRRGTARRDRGLPKADTVRPFLADHASQADLPTAARRDQHWAAAMLAAAAASVAEHPVREKRKRLELWGNRAALGSYRCAPCACTAADVARCAGARLTNRSVSTSDTGGAHKLDGRTRGGNATTGCFPCSILPWIPSCARKLSQRHVPACTDALTLQATAASGLANSTSA